MEQIIAHIIEHRYLYFLGFLALILVVLLITLKPKKVKPIETRVDDKREKTDIEKVMEELESKANSRPMTTFEEEQEANAIISYQELVAAVNAKKAQMNFENENKDTKTTVMEIVNNLESEEPSDIDTLEVSTEVTLEDKKFKNSEFISPIFGKDSNKNNEEFLSNLKDFRSTL